MKNGAVILNFVKKNAHFKIKQKRKETTPWTETKYFHQKKISSELSELIMKGKDSQEDLHELILKKSLQRAVKELRTW